MRKIDSAELRLVEAGGSGFVNDSEDIGYKGTLISLYYEKDDKELNFEFNIPFFRQFSFMFDFETFAFGYYKYGNTLIGLIKRLLD